MSPPCTGHVERRFRGCSKFRFNKPCYRFWNLMQILGTSPPMRGNSPLFSLDTKYKYVSETIPQEPSKNFFEKSCLSFSGASKSHNAPKSSWTCQSLGRSRPLLSLTGSLSEFLRCRLYVSIAFCWCSGMCSSVAVAALGALLSLAATGTGMSREYKTSSDTP